MNHRIKNLDVAILRTFLAVEEFGGFARAAEQIGRSESAVSLQLKRLEEQIEEPLYRRVGRRMILTETGGALLNYARRLVDLNDETIAAISGESLQGHVRLGVPPDFAQTWLPSLLAQFAHTYPSVKVDIEVQRSPVLIRKFEERELDIVMTYSARRPDWATWFSDIPMRWIGLTDFALHRAAKPLPLVVFAPPCFFRETACAALDTAGIPWKIVLTSPNLAGLWAALVGGLGISVRTAVGLPPQLAPLGTDKGLPDLPAIGLAMGCHVEGADATVIKCLGEMITGTLDATLTSAF